MLPDEMLWKPAIALSSVVLPQPEGPTTTRDFAGRNVERAMIDRQNAGALGTVILTASTMRTPPLRAAAEARIAGLCGDRLNVHRSPPSASSRVRHCIM